MIYLNLISGPRNISTALMYSFAQRGDTVVSDEPFYACYLSKTNVDHPGKEEVLKSQSADEEVVVRELFCEHEKPVLFIKNMAHHLEVLKGEFLSRCTNIFLIRDPQQIIASYSKVIQNPVMRDIGIEYEYRLFQKFPKSIVVDSGLLLQNPKSVLGQLCSLVEIKFEESMLHWLPGPKSYDGVWAPHWYANVHASTGFEKQSTSERALPNYLHSLYESSVGYYNRLLQFALKP